MHIELLFKRSHKLTISGKSKYNNRFTLRYLFFFFLYPVSIVFDAIENISHNKKIFFWENSYENDIYFLIDVKTFVHFDVF